jgi:cytochrome c-type biogenesis protein CcmH/NrfF
VRAAILGGEQARRHADQLTWDVHEARCEVESIAEDMAERGTDLDGDEYQGLHDGLTDARAAYDFAADALRAWARSL